MSETPARDGQWLPLVVNGGWNGRLRAAFDKRSGAYAIRDRSTGRVLYVGESHCDRGWKTLIRHFQDPTGNFARRNEFTHRSPERLDAAVWVTARGRAATRKQFALVSQMKPHHNRNDGRVRKPTCPSDGDGTDFEFGANAKNPGRSRKTGRYSFEGQWDRLCKCGHPLRHHLAEDPHGCIAGDFGADDCDCERFRPASAKNPSTSPSYRATHGGQRGPWTSRTLKVPDPRAGDLIVLGELVRVEYLTDKGEGAVTYFHDFGREHAGGVERGRVRPSRRPILAFNREGLVICGGAYVVKPEGIVG